MGFDVGVIGGGAIGLACAWRLAQRGVRVAVYERAATAGSPTGAAEGAATRAAGGMLAAQSESAGHPVPGGPLPTREAFFQSCLASRTLYPAFAAELWEASGVDLELSLGALVPGDWRKPGILFIADHADEGEAAHVEAAFARQKEQGHRVEATEFRMGARPSKAFWLADEGQVENRLLARALRLACEGAGVAVFEGAAVERQGDAWLANGELLACEQVLVCGGAWSGLLGGACAGVARPLCGQMLVLSAGRRVERIHYGSRAYLIPRRDGRLLVGATQEETGFQASATTDGARRLLAAAVEMRPDLAGSAILDHWAGLRPVSRDGLPVVGRLGERLWCATGHGRNGILLAPWTAQAIAAAILDGAEVPQAFSPARLGTVQEVETAGAK